MFQRNEYIVYEKYGVCIVADICNPPIPGADKSQLYYVLHPMSTPNQTIYTPVDSNKVLIRRILTKEEVLELISRIPSIETIWTANEKYREDNYKKAMRTYDTVEWIRIIKTLYLRKEERKAEGKAVTSTDERYLKTAETHLYEELSMALGIPMNEVEAYIAGRIKELEIVQMLGSEHTETENF